MGHSWSSRRRQNRHNHRHHQNPSPPQPSPSPPPPPPPPSSNRPPPQPSTPPPRPRPPTYAFAANSPYPAHQIPPQNPNSMVPSPFPISNPYFPTMRPSGYHPNYSIQGHGWPGSHPPAFLPPPLPPSLPPPPYVDHQSAKKIKNDVNVHRDTIRIGVDEKNPDHHLVSFSFDAEVDGSITIFYFGKEGANCTFTGLYPEIHMPLKIPFEKGLSQKFCQPSGTGIDLGFFDINELSQPLPGEDVFPLVILAESSLPSLSNDKQLDQSTVTTASHAQITQAVLEKNDESHFRVKVIKQILWVDGDRYELREIYGISSSTEATGNDNDSGMECVICMTEPKDTAVLPCRHMCLCCECAKELRLRSNKCPICRQPIEELMEIKVNEEQSES